MKNYVRIRIFLFLLITTLMGCKKHQVHLPDVWFHSDVTTYETAHFLAFVQDDGGSEITSVGFCWGTQFYPSVDGPSVTAELVDEGFEKTVTGFNAGETFYVRAFAINEKGIGYSSPSQFNMNALDSLGFLGNTLFLGSSSDGYTSYTWGSTGQEIGATESDNGELNTSLMVGYAGTEAAQYCNELEFAGFDDWYLPAIDELVAIYNNMDEWPTYFSDVIYWSSTEASTNEAKAVDFTTGEIIDKEKDYEGDCRCVRKE